MRNLIHRLLAILLLSLGPLTLPSMAADLPAVADTYTDTAVPAANYGGYGITAVAKSRVTLIRFDSKAIALARGDTGTLSLRVRTVKNWRDGLSLHMVQGAWDEKKVTAATLPPISPIVLDQKILGASDQGTTVTFDVSGALSVWRKDPSKNFGLAIVPTTPLPNLELFSREMKSGATLSIGGEVADGGRLWIGGTNIQLVRSNGEVVRTLPAAPAGQRYVDFANDPLTGGLWVESFTTNFDEPFSPSNTDRLVRLGPTGNVEASINVIAARAIMVDPRDGGIWVANLECVAGCYPDAFGDYNHALLKFDRHGNQVARISGFDFRLAVIRMDPESGVLWIRQSMGGGDGVLLRVSGSDQELSDYSVAGPGPHHTYFPGYYLAVAVNPNEDGQGRGNVWWEDNNTAQLVKVNALGGEFFRLPVDGYFDPMGSLEVDPLTGRAIACMGDIAGKLGYVSVSPSGVQTTVPLNPPYRQAVYNGECNRPLLLDPYRGVFWTSASQSVGANVAYSVLALDEAGHAVRIIERGAQSPGAMALQQIDVRVVVSNGGAAIDPKQLASLTVGILSRGVFDALQIDPNTARLGKARAAPKAYRARDLNGDGRPDLAMDFSVPATGIACGDLYVGLTAANYEAVPVAGNARISVAGCK